MTRASRAAAMVLLVTVLASTGCSGSPEVGDAFPEGSFRADLAGQTFAEAGLSETDTYNHAGVWTLTFDDGLVEVHDVNDATGKPTTEVGVYCVDRETIELGFDECGDFWTARWTSEGEVVRFDELAAGTAQEGHQLLLATIFASQSWTRVR